jgi:hypothetical protein
VGVGLGLTAMLIGGQFSYVYLNQKAKSEEAKKFQLKKQQYKQNRMQEQINEY